MTTNAELDFDIETLDTVEQLSDVVDFLHHESNMVEGRLWRRELKGCKTVVVRVGERTQQGCPPPFQIVRHHEAHVLDHTLF